MSAPNPQPSTIPAPPPWTGCWRVLRHGGRIDSLWRQIIMHGNAAVAHEAFEATVEAMRQGGVVLLNPDGAIARSAWAPRLRSRW
jgi:hypothetical protein